MTHLVYQRPKTVSGSQTIVPDSTDPKRSDVEQTLDQIEKMSDWKNAKCFCMNSDDLYMITCHRQQRESFVDMLSRLKPRSSERPNITRIIEFCCDDDSAIGNVGNSTLNVEVFRCTEQSDVITNQGFDRVKNHATANPGCHLFASIPLYPLVTYSGTEHPSTR